jgi:hypothetical protein
MKARSCSRTIVGVILTRARTEAGVGISCPCPSGPGSASVLSPAREHRSELTRLQTPPIYQRALANAHAHHSTQTIPMTTDQPENKKRKVSPEPDAGTLPPTSNLLIKRLSEKAKLPTRGSALAAGYDLYRYGRETGCRVLGANFLSW